jgi:hypothetical protein
MSARVPLSAKDTMRLIERSPSHPEDAAIYTKEARRTAWFNALLECGVLQKDGHNYLVQTQMFFDHKDKLWEKVQRAYLRNLAAPVFQPPLQPPFQLNSSTSRDAAMSMKHEAPRLRQRVYELLSAEAHTDYETSMILVRPENSVRPRRIELVRLHLVGPVGTKTGPTGRRATLWGAV